MVPKCQMLSVVRNTPTDFAIIFLILWSHEFNWLAPFLRQTLFLSINDLTGTQFALPAHVQRYGLITSGEFAQKMSLEVSTMSRNLQPLVSAGYLVNNHVVDSRSRQVSMTPEGLKKLKEADKNWAVDQKKVTSILGNRPCQSTEGFF